MPERRKPRTLGALLYDGFELLDLYGPLEMFGTLGPERVRIVTVAEHRGPVASSQGPQTVAEHAFDDCPRLDLVLVPGGVGTLAALTNEPLLAFLRERAATAKRTMSVCSGSAILARAGLLEGRRATSNKIFFRLASAQSDGVVWEEAARWVVDGPFVTSSGVSAGTDMALAVIADLHGPAFAEYVAVLTEYTWHRDAAHDPYAASLDRPPTPPG